MVLASIRILVCGTDFPAVEAVLGGMVEKKHYAWNRRYEVTCTSVTDVEHADSRLLSMCNLVVLTKGAQSPSSRASYDNKPTISLQGAPVDAVELLKGCNFYYGECSLGDLRDVVVNIGLSPMHIIWNADTKSTTPTGELVLRRAFWLLDKDGDGVLSEEEILAWQRSATSISFSKSDITELMNDAALSMVTVPMGFEDFMAIHKRYLMDGNAEKVWATLHITGLHPNGLPYSWRDINAVRVSKECNTYLSHNAIQFFRNLYKLRRFHDTDGMWSVTPGCPWLHISGFIKSHVPLDKFIEYWKYMAVVKREVVIQYALYWGYKGDAALLFQLRRARPYREPGESVPNIITVLVLGSAGCGRRSLIFTLTATDDELYDDQTVPQETYVRTTTFFVRKGADEVPQTVAYVTVPIDSASSVLENAAHEKQVDAVLLCYDGSCIAKTTPPIMEAYLKAVSMPQRCHNLPFIVVATKAEVAVKSEGEHKQALQEMKSFCHQHRLLWPPVSTSVETPEETEIATVNEYVYAVAREPEIAIARPPITPLRLVRRVVIVSLVTVAVGSMTRFLVRKIFGSVRRKAQ
ncbi:unnamed protein product [Trypanosoma congolense IL3000]|uniref:WGS project CAEQ00000000 data, annotated contig 944 n=1 Tax=Trypanosoma congolense (strain IL3000) TaxID=1068625 RepID=F9WJS3_TRYCI|nr:unnamed protein product [Trypanosoma congolense IL3000]